MFDIDGGMTCANEFDAGRVVWSHCGCLSSDDGINSFEEVGEAGAHRRE